MLLTSPSFKHGENIPNKFTCSGSTSPVLNRVGGLTTGGGSINPELQIQNVSKEAKSLALIMDDPDATRGATFTHWFVWNIDPCTTVIKEESVPPGSVEGVNDFGKIGYGGPCPPEGGKPHRYFFKLYALDAIISLSEGSSKNEVEKEIEKHIVEKAELVGLYQMK